MINPETDQGGADYNQPHLLYCLPCLIHYRFDCFGRFRLENNTCIFLYVSSYLLYWFTIFGLTTIQDETPSYIGALQTHQLGCYIPLTNPTVNHKLIGLST